jgi:hypothetical protein
MIPFAQTLTQDGPNSSSYLATIARSCNIMSAPSSKSAILSISSPDSDLAIITSNFDEYSTILIAKLSSLDTKVYYYQVVIY